MIHLLMSHPGTHAVAHAAPIAALPLIFRRAIAAVRRKPAARADCNAAWAAEVRRERDFSPSDWDDAMPAEVAAAARHPETAPGGYPVLRDRMLSQVRNEWDRQGLVPAQQAAHADAVHAMSARYLPAAPELSGNFRRPVNGRSLPDQPRRQPVYGEVPQLEVERDAARAAGERARQHYEPASPRLLDQVLAGLRRL